MLNRVALDRQLLGAFLVTVALVSCSRESSNGGTSVARKQSSSSSLETTQTSAASSAAEQILETPTNSMAPTIVIGDKIAFKPATGPLSRGDIVAYRRPPFDPKESMYIHRVIGLPGENVEARDAALWINEQRLSEPYLAPGTTIYPFPAMTVPADSYWLMGDNRDHAADSRISGPIPRQGIIAVATRIDQPPTRRRPLP